MDRVTAERRSYIMSRVPTRDSRPELLVRKMLYDKGYRYRLHPSKLPGRPDIAIPRLRMAIFVHGCFWHGHDGCVKGGLPKSNVEYWSKKICENRRRDANVLQALAASGWTVEVVWQCETKDPGMLAQRLEEITRSPTGAA